jgi:RNA polymerase sigma-70 factor, ECF subfamily
MPGPAGSDSSFDFDEVCRRYGPKIKAMLFNYTGDEDLAEDIAQEALLRAYQFQRAFNPQAPVWPWLATIARHV